MKSTQYADRMRTQAKALFARGVMQLARFRPAVSSCNGARIVMYHGVPAASSAQFQRHLAYFSQAHNVVSLDVLAQAIAQGRSVDGWLAITIDDGLKNNAEIAAPLLRESGLSACVFVATNFVSIDAGQGLVPHPVETEG